MLKLEVNCKTSRNSGILLKLYFRSKLLRRYVVQQIHYQKLSMKLLLQSMII